MPDQKAHVGILQVELFIPASGSLKSKRRVLRGLKDRIRGQFNVSIAEIDDLDKWQKTVFGICAINHDKQYLDGCLQKVLSLLGSAHEVEIVGQVIEFI